jgi:polysaccharide export outer membrane protein
VKIYTITVQTTAQALALVGFVQVVSAQIAPVQPLPDRTQAAVSQQQAAPANGAPAAPASVALPPDYVIGPEDVLAVMFWRDKEMSGEYVVRPDGQITLPLLNDVQAAGLTPEQLKDELTKAASKLMEDPTVTVGVKAINSRRVHITGMVAKPGAYALTSPMTVVQLIATAGGLHEFADKKKILIVRNESGRQVAFKFNYKDFLNGKNLKQNIQLKPGDTVVIP